MTISPRMKFGLVTLAVIGVGLVLIVQMVATQSKVLAAMFLVWIFVGSILMSRVRCPSCGTPVGYLGQLGKLSIHGGFAMRYCRNCGFDLSSKETRTTPTDSSAR
jgi:hypothetical protein